MATRIEICNKIWDKYRIRCEFDNEIKEYRLSTCGTCIGKTAKEAYNAAKKERQAIEYIKQSTPQQQTIDTNGLSIEKLKEIHGNTVCLKTWKGTNGALIQTQINSGGFFHIRIVYKGIECRYRQKKDGSYTGFSFHYVGDEL